MQLREITPKAATKELIRMRPQRSQIDSFKGNLLKLLGKVDEIEREENQKNHVRDFLLDTYYKETNEINTKDNKDLVIHLGMSSKDKVGVIIEAKRPNNKSEMMTIAKPNTKALQELVLYYMRERIDEKNIDIKNCIATNIYEWFIIDAQYFEKFFAKNKAFVKDYEDWRDGKKVTKDTALFYNDIARPFIDKLQEEIPVTHFDIRHYEKALNDKNKKEDKSLIALYKAQSPYHLLRTSSADSNALNDKFYKELLHIIGLEEAKEGGKIIMRRAADRQPGSLIENTLNILEGEDLYRIKNYEQYGANKNDRLFNIALELTLTWVNRILFLKLLEGQLTIYHRGSKDFLFLNTETIHDYDELYRLFHQVLARSIPERADAIRRKYRHIPYLNSSLFEISELEDQATRVNTLDNAITLDLMHNSVLKDKVRKGERIRTLDYIFRFLDAYEFSGEGNDDIQENNKSLINASVLGKVFEKINGYKDGSVYTPGFLTTYMCRESIRKSVLDKFNRHYNWTCTDLHEVYNKIEDRKEANTVINSLHICDPAVGSGHFLVSALNEVIAIKAELGVLQDEHGKRVKDYQIEIINDELVITDEYNDPFLYMPGNKESQRIQKTLFQEKQTIIENCLFGVDINTTSVKICRLRLWIELLKNAYYTEESGYTELETLPNIDINIKLGNSLVSRYPLDSDLSQALKGIDSTISEYRNAVQHFKNATDRDEKRKLLELINAVKSGFQTYFSIHDDRRQKLSKARGEIVKLQSESLFDSGTKKSADTKKKIEALDKRIKQLESEIEEIKNNVIYQNAFEWRFEFPEVLNNDGVFEGFDILIGNPPYIQLQKMGHMADCLQAQGYETFVRTGDIYSLFYEKGWQLLKPQGCLVYITSNKWMRAEYGESTRRFFAEKTDPMLLIDFAGQKIFDAATVDVNILMFAKDKNRQQTTACIIKEKVLNNLSDYVHQQSTICPFIGNDSWVILSRLEQGIKAKIEAIGKPLKDWDVQINYGIKTGFNEAFIIDGVRRKELIEQDPKSAEIIRPILRGRDIKRYGYDFADLWLINSHNGTKEQGIKPVNIDDYPAVKSHLNQFYNQIEKRLDKGITPYNLRNCAYMDDFNKQKIIWGEISDKTKFCIDLKGDFMAEATTFLMTGQSLLYILGYLNSKISEYLFSKIGTTTGVGTVRWKKYTIEQLPIPTITIAEEEKFGSAIRAILFAQSENKAAISEIAAFNTLLYEKIQLSKEEIAFIDIQ